MEKRVISTQLQEEDYKIESSLRPQRLEDYIGQEKIKSNMKVYIEAAKARQESLYCFMDHRDLERQRLQGSLQMRWVPT